MNNINKIYTSVKDKECDLIHKSNLSKCIFYRNSRNNIIKKFKNSFEYNHEICIYLYLLDKNITLLSTPDNLSLRYNITNEISLYTYLINYTHNIKFILNELFCFINTFKYYKFLHGNLHIHNIFLNPLQTSHFYVIDFTNSKIFNKPNYTQKSKNIIIYNWDFFTLYISLKMFFKNNIKILIYLDNLIQTYINKIDLESLLNEYKNLVL